MLRSLLYYVKKILHELKNKPINLMKINFTVGHLSGIPLKIYAKLL